MVRPSRHIDMNPVKRKYYPLMINLVKRNGSSNILSRKKCVPKEIKDIKC